MFPAATFPTAPVAAGSGAVVGADTGLGDGQGAGAVVASALSASDSTTGSESGTTDMTRIPQGKGNSDGHSMWQTAARTGGSLALRGVTPGLRDGPKHGMCPHKSSKLLTQNNLCIRWRAFEVPGTGCGQRGCHTVSSTDWLSVHWSSYGPPTAGEGPLFPPAGRQRRSAAVWRAMDSDRRRPHDVVAIA